MPKNSENSTDAPASLDRLVRCPACQSPRTESGQPSRRIFYGCGSYGYDGDNRLTDQTDLCCAWEQLRKIEQLVTNALTSEPQVRSSELVRRLRSGIHLKSRAIEQRPGGVKISHDHEATKKTMAIAADEIVRLESIIQKARVQFFVGGSDGETAADMLAILNEQEPPNAEVSRSHEKNTR